LASKEALTWAGGLLKLSRKQEPEQKGKLTPMTTATALPEPRPGVNGPDDVLWDAIDWRTAEKDVRRLRRRIFKATQVGDWPKVRSLQKIMLASRSNALVSVRRVTQRNTGRRTAGIDGEVALTSAARAKVAAEVLATRGSWQPVPVRRVHIPKARDATKRRPLGIPVIMDRCHQARVKNALEPEWEARFEPKSFGFRPGRSCHDAIGALFTTLKGPQAKRVWILDADLAAAFDKIDHSHLMSVIGSFPARDLIRGWLQAGVFEAGKGFAPTVEGTPQGGVISPVLLNVALHGMEEAAGVRYCTTPASAGCVKPDSPIVVRYADDLAVCCHSEQQAEQVKVQLERWLQPRGLAFNEDKTRVVHLGEGFDFLGFTLRRHRTQRGGKLLITASKAAVRRLRRRLSLDARRLRGSNAAAVIAAFNPVIRGWAAYYRGVVSKEIFAALDHHMWTLTYKWAHHTHRGDKPKKWVVERYFGKFNKIRDDHWVFGDRDSGAYLVKFAWVEIERHQTVKGANSPDDPALIDYWRQRRTRTALPLDGHTRRLLAKQDWQCPLCGDLLLDADHPPHDQHDWERWMRAIRKAILADGITHGRRGKPTDQVRLVHASCRRKATARERRNPDLLQPDSP